LTAPSGSADPVLLLHGQPGSGRDWAPVVAALGERAAPLAIDRPGWDGASDAMNLAGNARAAINALGAAGIAQATVVGHSFGGAVAAQLAVAYPERVGALVLIAPAANVASLYAIDRVLAAPVLGELGSLLVAAAGRALGRPAALRAFTVEQRSLVRDLPALEARLPSIHVPTAVIIGARDLIVPLHSARELTRTIPGAELRVVPRAGHLLPLRQAGLVADTIARIAQGAVPS
jgi:3-oxoadipate enol-lactonase